MDYCIGLLSFWSILLSYHFFFIFLLMIPILTCFYVFFFNEKMGGETATNSYNLANIENSIHSGNLT